MSEELRQRVGEAGLGNRTDVERVEELKASAVDAEVIYAEPPAGKIYSGQPEMETTMPPPPANTPRILIAIPSFGPNLEFLDGFLPFWTQLITRKDVRMEVAYKFIKTQGVAMAEIEAVKTAQQHGCTHLLLMDDDIYNPSVEYLDMLLKADKDVVSGVMYASGFPYAMCTFRRFDQTTTVSSQPLRTSLYRLYEVPCRCPHCMADGVIVSFNDWADKECPNCKKQLKDFAIQPVDLIPFPFTLFKMGVFDRIKKPWFHCTTEFPTDSWFADRCIEAGIQEYAHMQVRLNHRGITDTTRPFRYQEGMAVRTAEGKSTQVVQILPEQMMIHEKLIEQRMNEAEMALQLSLKGKFCVAGGGEPWVVHKQKED